VTAEAFMEWKAKFDAEMLALKIAQGGHGEKSNEDKPTGKQLFLSNRAGLEEALIAAGEQETSAQLAAVMAAAARRAAGIEDGGEGDAVLVKEDLFLEDCDEDLDDLLDEDDEDYEEGEDDDDENS
jgi:hypothetical protein